MDDSHPFHSMSSGRPIPEIRLFQTLTLKLQGQGHGCGQRARSYSRPSILSPVPQISAFSLRRKCGWEYSDRNVEKYPHSYMEKNAEKDVEEMRRKCGWEYSDRNAEKSPLFIWKKMWRKCGWEYLDRNVEKSLHSYMEKNVEEMRRKCGWEYSDRNAEKSPHFYMEKSVEEMRRKCGWEYSDRNAEKYPHYIRISAKTRRTSAHSQFSASQP